MTPNDKPFIIIPRNSPVMHAPHHQLPMWELHRPIKASVLGCIESNPEVGLTRNPIETTLTHVAPLWNFENNRELVMAFRYLEDPISVVRNILSKILMRDRRRSIHLMSDAGLVRASFDHDGTVKMHVIDQPLAYFGPGELIAYLRYFFMKMVRTTEVSLDEKLALFNGFYFASVRALDEGARYFDQRMDDHIGLTRSRVGDWYLGENHPLEIHALAREIVRVYDPRANHK